jgi:hypothetical protein
MYRNLAPILSVVVAMVCTALTNAQTQHHDHPAAGHSHALHDDASSSASMGNGPHGGSLRQIDGVQLETVVSQGGIHTFVFDRDGRPVSVDHGRGAASLRVAGYPKRYRYDLSPDGRGGLTAPVDLSAIAGQQIEIDIQLVGIPGTKGRTVTLQEVASVPASEQQLAAAAIARQKICPVSGKPLGSMGDPIKVMIGDKPIFLCCRGCFKKVQANPARYLAMVYGNTAHATAPPQGTAVVPAGREQVRTGVFKVSAADVPFIAAQKRCPVMDEPLDAMGGPYKVHAAGKAIYICCPGCAKKIVAEPQKYLGILARQGVNAPVLQPVGIPAGTK